MNRATLTATPAAGPIDGPLHVRIDGIPAGAAVTVRATLLDTRRVAWSSHATFIADAEGSVDLTTTAPVCGAYSGVSGDGLMASLAVANDAGSRPFDSTSIAPLLVDFVAEMSGRRVAAAKAPRFYVADGVRMAVLKERGLSGPIPFSSLMAPSLSAARSRVFRSSPAVLSPLFDAALAEPLPADVFIPVEQTNGAILLISGDDDLMWPSARMGDQIMARLAAHQHPFRSRHCRYPGAGHLMRPPGVPTSVLQGRFAFGGASGPQAKANRLAWSETLAFLATHLRRSSSVETVVEIGV